MASDIFAKIGDIKGESLDDKHKDEIEVLSWSWGVSNPGSRGGGSGGGAGKATFHDLSFTHHIDKASPVLLKGVRDRPAYEGSDDHASQGRQGPAGVPDHQDERRDHHQRLERREPGQPRRRASALAFAKVDLEYKPQKADGSLDAGLHFKYDIKGNKEG